MDFWGRLVDYNWFVYPEHLTEVRELNVDANSMAGDPLFVDPVSGNFSLAPGSPIYTLGWKNFAMDCFGVQKASLKAIAKTPEIPAIIKPTVEIENQVLFYSGQIKNLTTDGELSATGMAEKRGVLILSPPVEGVFRNLKLQANDVVLRVNEQNTDNVTALRSAIQEGEIKTITVWRNQRVFVQDSH